MATNYKNFSPGLTSTKLPNTPEQKLEFFNSIDCTLSNPDDVSKITFAYEGSYGAAYFSVSEEVSFTTLGEKVEFMVNESHTANQTVNYSSLTDSGPSHIGTFKLSVSNFFNDSLYSSSIIGIISSSSVNDDNISILFFISVSI